MPAVQSSPSSPKSPLQVQCGRLAVLAAAASVLLVGLVALETLGPWLVKPVVLADRLFSIASLVAPSAYVFGVWRLGRVLKAFAHEGRFVTAAFEALRSVGLVLALGAIFTLAIEPGLSDRAQRRRHRPWPARRDAVGLRAPVQARGPAGA